MNMEQIFRSTLYLILTGILFLVSCIPGRELSFEYLTPAEYSLPNKSSKALIFNSAYLPKVDTSSFNIVGKLEEEERHIVDTLIINNIFNGFFFVVDDSPLPVLNSSVYAEMRGKDTTNFLQPLSAESIDYLLKEFSSDLIISLEYYGMNYDYSTNWNAWDEVKAYLAIDRALVWRIYSRDSLIREKIMRDTLYWSAYGESSGQAADGLPSLTGTIREAFWFAGEEFAMEFSPSWEKTKRSYFIIEDGGKDRSLDETFLREQGSHHNRIKAYKANFNLSVWHEERGNIDKALEYMNAALDLRPHSALAKYYKKQQVKKLKKMEKLKKQIN